MGNSTSQNEVGFDSRVIKISESLAQKLTINKPDDHTSTKTQPTAPTTPPSQRQEDGTYMHDEVSQAFMQQDELNKHQLKIIDEKFAAVCKALMSETSQPAEELKVSPEQEKLTQCFAKNPNDILRCHIEVENFLAFTQQAFT